MSATVKFHFFLLATLCLSAIIYGFDDRRKLGTNDLKQNSSSSDTMVLEFSKVNGAGCPYTASWLANVNLFSKAHWWMESTKMEAASFNIFDKARWKFQLADPDAYFVHHMSMYEHLIHRKHGFDEAQKKTLILSETAIAGECYNLTINDSNEYMALIPFYGGLPPNVTKDMSKVHSIGQGNSLVSWCSMIHYCLAMCMCSLKRCLRSLCILCMVCVMCYVYWFCCVGQCISESFAMHGHIVFYSTILWPSHDWHYAT